MKKTSAFFIIIFLVFDIQSYAQSNKTLIDIHYNTYSISNHILTKQEYNSEKIYHFEFETQSRISKVDISNPLRILVFSEEINAYTFLDNRLSQIGNLIKLDNLGYFNISQVCTAQQGGVWIFDENDLKLKLISNQGSTIIESGIINTTQQPIAISEHHNKVYLSGKLATYIFNTNGSYLNTINIKLDTQPLLWGNLIIYSQKNTLYSYNTKNFESSKIKVFNQDIKNIQKEKNSLIIFHSNQHKNSKIKLEEIPSLN